MERVAGLKVTKVSKKGKEEKFELREDSTGTQEHTHSNGGLELINSIVFCFNMGESVCIQINQ